VKVYKRKLNCSMAYVLILLYRYDQQNGDTWVHVPSYLAKMCEGNPRRAAAVRGDWAKLKHWDLIDEREGKRDDGSKRAGYYRITEHGRAFVYADRKVPPHIYLYNQQVIDKPIPVSQWITIRDALGTKFNYAELMEES
jgi:hypothetical protein